MEVENLEKTCKHQGKRAKSFPDEIRQKRVKKRKK